jgi:hypothetical protein
VLVVQEDAQAVGLVLDVVLERLDERLRVIGRAHALRLHETRDAAVGGLRCLAGAGEKKTQQVARRLAGGERLLGQAHREVALEPQHQLDASQTVQAQVALERAVERDISLHVRPRFFGHRGDNAEQPVRIDRRFCGGRQSFSP